MIEIKETKIEILMQNIEDLKESCKNNDIITENKLPENQLLNLKNLLSVNDLEKFYDKIRKPTYLTNLNYDEFIEIFDLLKLLYSNIKDIKDEIDIKIFLKDGYKLDLPKLKKKFNDKKLSKEFPNFNITRLAELYKSPPKTIKTYYDDTLEILIDPFEYRKYLLGLIQMIFNHMDLLICCVGGEGTGKSTKVSQYILMVYWTLKEIGIIEYEYDIKEMFFNTLYKFREAEDKYFTVPFRIFALDEGNELNRQDWKDDEVKTFFQRLRRERHNRRIKFISLPVLGELITNIILSRMNFITDMKNKNEVQTGTLYKGEYDLYIIPRGDKIYSPYHKKEITQTEIKSKLYINLKDKEYLKGIPKEILIKKCKANGVWGFKESEYITVLKDSNKTFSVTKGINFGYTELFMFYKARVTLKKLLIKKNDIRYASMSKMINKVSRLFYENPDLMLKYEAIYQKKKEDKEERNNE